MIRTPLDLDPIYFLFFSLHTISNSMNSFFSDTSHNFSNKLAGRKFLGTENCSI